MSRSDMLVMLATTGVLVKGDPTAQGFSIERVGPLDYVLRTPNGAARYASPEAAVDAGLAQA